MLKSFFRASLRGFRLDIARLQSSSFDCERESCKVIFMNTMPKSGSMFILDSLISILPSKDIQHSHVSANQGFPFDEIVKNRLVNTLKSKDKYHLVQEHIACSLVNTRLLESSLSQMILHIRDPRAALLSWVHHFENNLRLDVSKLYNIEYQIPLNYAELTLADRLDYDLHNLLPCFTDWLKRWVSFYDNPNRNIKILLSTHYELKEDSELLLKKICDFYRIEGAYLDKLSKPQKGVNHFRKGLSTEFFDAFTEKQLNFANSIMDPEWFDRFNWPKLASRM